MIKYTLISCLILAVVMLYMANKMLAVKKHLEKEVLGIYTKQLEEMEKVESEIYAPESSAYNLPEELK